MKTKTLLVATMIILAIASLTGCGRESERVSYNIAQEADNFNVLRRVVVINTRTDKAEFEKWVNNLDDNLYEEIWESLSNKFGLKELNSMYEGANYKNVISCFKNEAKNITQNKINELQSLLKTLN